VEFERSLGIQQDWSKLAAAADAQIYDVRERKQVIALLKQLESDPVASSHSAKQEEVITRILDESPKTVKERLQSCKKETALAAAYEIINQSSSLQEPLEMFHPTAVLLQFGDKDEAVFWFYAAQLRTRYQLVFEGGDRGQLLTIMMATIGSQINNYAFQDTSKLIRTLNRVLDWDKKTVNPHRDRPKTDSTEVQIRKIYTGFDELRTKISADKVNLERDARSSPVHQQTMEAMFADRCRK